ncbi:MAG: translesion error-prone DNA polymerase V autoproteolytic subunit [Bacteroidota bacterium]|nr:translesion error-prone DNA polymerase V autoproteolytic subunit [Bacteroidota bacterium]
MKLVYYNAGVRAGFPSPATDYLEERIDLNREFIPHPNSTFLVSSIGDSMIGAFIPPRATLVVDRSIIPQNGSIVVAVINGEFTVKFLQKNDYFCRLVPANPKYPEIRITPEMDMQIWGVVTRIIIDPKEVRQCTL